MLTRLASLTLALSLAAGCTAAQGRAWRAGLAVSGAALAGYSAASRPVIVVEAPAAPAPIPPPYCQSYLVTDANFQPRSVTVCGGGQ